MKIAIALYKHQLTGWSPHATFDRLSRFVGGRRLGAKWVPGLYSHSELVLPENGKWMFYSASFRDDGVRKKEIKPEAGRWDFIILDRTEEEVVGMKAMFGLLIGCRYDWPALGRFVFGSLWLLNMTWWFFCSEIVALLLRIPRPERVHPCHLAVCGEIVSELPPCE